MKKFALYLFAFLISFDAFAMTTGYFQQQESKVSGSVKTVPNELSVTLTQANPSTGTLGQMRVEQQDEFATEILIYALILLVYSIYWLHNYGQVKRTSAKHKILERENDINGERAK